MGRGAEEVVATKYDGVRRGAHAKKSEGARADNEQSYIVTSYSIVTPPWPGPVFT